MSSDGVSDAPSLIGLRVLVAEDEAILAMIMEEILSDLGCKVVGIADRVEDACAMARRADFDVALLDVDLNGTMIYPAAEELMRRGVPFVFVTGFARDDIAAPYRDHALLNKPVRQAELREALTVVAAEGPR